MVLFSSGMGLLIEIWKVQKGMLTSVERRAGGRAGGREGGREGGRGCTHTQPIDNAMTTLSLPLSLPPSLPPSLPLLQLRWTDPATGARFWFPRLTFSAVESYTQNKTQEYDSEATAHLLYVPPSAPPSLPPSPPSGPAGHTRSFMTPSLPAMSSLLSW